MSARILASRAGWGLCCEFETIWVTNNVGRRWNIGWMYGNPEAGLITWDGRYALVVGCGMVVADLERFGESPLPHQSWPQAPMAHLLCEPHDLWHFEPICSQVEQDGQTHRIRLVTDLRGERPGIYEVNLPSLNIVRID